VITGRTWSSPGRWIELRQQCWNDHETLMNITCGYRKVDPREILRVLSELGGPESLS
jgi:hypothetical protein